MANVDKKQCSEDSKASIFTSSRYQTGKDHTAWYHAYALNVLQELGHRRDLITESAIEAVMSHAMQVVRDVLSTAVHFTMQGKRLRLETRDVENSIDARYTMLSFLPSNVPTNVHFRLSDCLNKSIYPHESYMVELRAVMNLTPRRLPYKRRIRKHWLVIDGEQPRVPENPLNNPSTSNAAQENGGNFQSSSNDSLMEDGNRTTRAANKLDQTLSRPITTHSLSLDQQVFFRKSVETIICNSNDKRREVLHLLSSDPGLQSLVPRFSLLIFEGVRCNIVEKNLPVLWNILRLLKTLIDNVQVNLDKCLHDIIPSLCSCVVCRELSSDPHDKQHYRIRHFAAKIMALICKRTHLADVRARITTLLCRVFNDSRANLASLYGALFALEELGYEVISKAAITLTKAALSLCGSSGQILLRAREYFQTVASVVLPRLDVLRKRIAILNKASPLESDGGEKVMKLIEKMLARFVRHRKMPNLNDVSDYEKVFPGFGAAVYRNVKAIEQRRALPGAAVHGQESRDSGSVQNAAQKRYPRLPQLPMRAPGIIRPIHASVSKLRMFKNNRRTTSGPSSQSSLSTPRTPQPNQDVASHLSIPSATSQPQIARAPTTQSTGPLPAVVVEPAFPRRPSASASGEQQKTHPAVTVEPAFPRRPGPR